MRSSQTVRSSPCASASRRYSIAPSTRIFTTPWAARRSAKGSFEPVGIIPMLKQLRSVSSLSANARMRPSLVSGIESSEGRILALADKLDTLRSCFSIGMMPTGSKDPFALRRAAQGVVKILVEGAMEYRLDALAQGELRTVWLERIQHYFREVRGFKYDE